MLLYLPGQLQDDTKNTPRFMALEPENRWGSWKLICHNDCLQANSEWFDDHFVALYRSVDVFANLEAQDPCRQPFRRTIRSDRQARATLMEASGLNMTLPTGRPRPTARKPAVRVMIDQQSFPELVNPWQPVSNPTAPPPPRSRRTSKTKKQVSYADALTVSSSQSTALTSATTTVTAALEQKVNKLAQQLQAQVEKTESIQSDLSSLKTKASQQDDKLTTVCNNQQQFSTRQDTLQTQIETIQQTQVQQSETQQQVSTALNQFLQTSNAQFEHLASLIRGLQSSPSASAITPSPPTTQAPLPSPPVDVTNSTNQSTPSIPTNAQPSDTTSRSASRPREPATGSDPETRSPPHKRTCPPFSPDTQYVLDNSSPIHVPEDPPVPALRPTETTPAAPTTLFPSASAPSDQPRSTPSIQTPSVPPSAAPSITTPSNGDPRATAEPASNNLRCPGSISVNPYTTARRPGNSTTGRSTDGHSNPPPQRLQPSGTGRNGPDKEQRPPAAPDPTAKAKQS